MSIWMLLFTYGKRQIQVQKPQINQVQFNVQGHFHISGQDPSVPKSNRLHVATFQGFFYEF